MLVMQKGVWNGILLPYKMKEIFVSPKIRVKPSDIHGMGVFAVEPINKGEIVEVSHCVDVPYKQHNRKSVMGKCFYDSNKAHSLWMVLGFGMIYNHSFSPNVEFRKGENKMEYSTNKDVESGEELFVLYTSHKKSFERTYLT